LYREDIGILEVVKSTILILVSILFQVLGNAPNVFGQSGSFYSFGQESINEQGTWLEFKSDGSLLCYGNSYSSGNWDLTIQKLGLDGELISAYEFGSASDDFAKRVIRNSDDLLFAGFRQAPGASESEAVVWQVDEMGNILNEFAEFEPGVFLVYNTIDVCADGGFVAAGYRKENTLNNPFISRYDVSGSLVWKKEISTSASDYLMGIEETPSGEFIAVGDRYIDSDSIYNIFFTKLSASGTVLWDTLMAFEANGGSRQLISTTDGNFLACGEGSPAIGEPFDFYFIKISESAEVLFRSWTGSEGGDACFDVLERYPNEFVACGYGADRFGDSQLALAYINEFGIADSFSYFGLSSIDIGQGIAVSGSRIAVFGQSFELDNQYALVIETFGFAGLEPGNDKNWLITSNPAMRGGFLSTVDPSIYTISMLSLEGKLLELHKNATGTFSIPNDIATGNYLLYTDIGRNRPIHLLIK
jgi:hypothetical protein